ncbi:MAG: 1,2-phenylacetyl-CoA epoxidase subunit PaaD [Terriglobales bacterium]
MVEQVRAWLEEIADPEIPALSIVDLGIVREARWQGDELEVTITPTYSGCPAMDAIRSDIEAALRAHGVRAVRLRTQLAPAWTTDWISARGREKLRGFGIAPPAAPALSAIAPAVACPHCGSHATECVSAFGATGCKALYRCRACREPFDYFKPLA